MEGVVVVPSGRCGAGAPLTGSSDANRSVPLPDRRRGDPVFAVTATLAGIDIQIVGLILMVIGVIGFVLSLIVGRRQSESIASREYV